MHQQYMYPISLIIYMVQWISKHEYKMKPYIFYFTNQRLEVTSRHCNGKEHVNNFNLKLYPFKFINRIVAVLYIRKVRVR